VVELDRVPEHASMPLLCEEERERASRLRFAGDRRRFIAAHGALRIILGRGLDVRPESLRFVRNPFGKPLLSDTNLHFSLSHSASLAVVGVAEGIEVGVDVELVQPRAHLSRIAGRIFAPDDLARFQAARDDERIEMFYRLWTQTEARLKACGKGFSQPANTLARGYAVEPIEPADGYFGAIAAKAAALDIVLHTFVWKADPLLQVTPSTCKVGGFRSV
jgi:4'-phosphopantetheinyl transferase